MDLESFVSLKTSPELEVLSNELQLLINILAGGKKSYKNQNNKGNQLLKNPKIQLLKDKTENKVNLVLNKLSEINFNNLLIEFMETIGKMNEQEYKNLQRAFYLKMQSDISFVKIYVEFFKIISNIYCSISNVQPDFIFKIIESKFMHDYYNVSYDEETEFLMEFDSDDKTNTNSENRRINNINIIRNMIYTGLINNNIEDKINKEILEQTNYYTDIYYWYQNTDINDEVKKYIKNKILSNTLPLRDKVLLDNLISDNVKTENVVVTKKAPIDSAKVDTLNIETENIIEEYLYMSSIDEVKAFIETRCKDAITKNKFCQFLFNKYFESSQESANKILDFTKVLVKKQILFKSNLSRGILMIHNNWNDLSLDYNNPNKKMKELLTLLKNMGITKNLESLLKLFKIEFVEVSTF